MLVDVLKKNLPEYKITLPVTKKKISFRPLLVKEEKFISAINELSSSVSNKLINLSNLVDSCCNDSIKSVNLPIYDFQYLLAEIRKNSVLEISKLKMTCPHTKERVDATVNLIEYKKKKNTNSELSINVSDNMTIEFRIPTLKDLTQIDNFIKSKTELIQLMALCLIGTETPEEKIDLASYSYEQKIEFLEYLSTKDFYKVKDFIMDSFITFKIEYLTSDNKLRNVEVNDFVNFLKFYLIMLI
jgi:hypothetical protein